MPTSSFSSLHSSRSRPRLSSDHSQGASSTAPGGGGMRPNSQQQPRKASPPEKKERAVRYGECRKNHAANIGGYAVDGCREFMASGEEGTSAALRCAACSCHRSFHKREVDEPADHCDCSSNSTSRR